MPTQPDPDPDTDRPDGGTDAAEEIRRLAARLLDSDGGATGPTAEGGPGVAEGPGNLVGPYRLIREIGRGGMGTVFLAEQERPIRRRVALKVINPGMDTRRVIARFEAERQALALMDHPNIARVLDAGATATGRPFFVMELVRGIPITEFCDRNRLTPRERLELFLPVCRAIQHAHQKGIIHRDVKPSNVLVALHDGRPEPRVIDFGVAKAVDQRLTEQTLFTEFGALVGTLEYMSPEQADPGTLDVDTRTDIYSLGVLLYELLTGSTPLERAALRRAAYGEVLRRIREQDPPTPSSRLRDSNDELPSISARRKTDPARLPRLLRGDLDWIAMKALEKDRTRRYATPGDLAQDILRHLDGDAVAAGPPSTAYRLGRFARKHRAGIAVAGSFLLLLVAATAVSAGLAVWAFREKDRADVARRDARAQQGRAEEQANQAVEAVRRFGEVIRDNPQLQNDPKLAPLREKLMKDAQSFFRGLRDTLLAEDVATPGSLRRLARACEDLAELTAEIGSKADALAAYRQAVAVRERLAGRPDRDAGLLEDLARAQRGVASLLTQIERHGEAVAEGLGSLNEQARLGRGLASTPGRDLELSRILLCIGTGYRFTGRTADASASFQSARAICERLDGEHPRVELYQSGLAKCDANLAALAYETGDMAQASQRFKRVVEVRQRLLEARPGDSKLRGEYAHALNDLGFSLRAAGDLEGAWSRVSRAAEINRELLAESPASTTNLERLSANYSQLIVIAEARRQLDDALKAYEVQRSLLAQLIATNPDVVELHLQLAFNWISSGFALHNARRNAEIWPAFEQAERIYDDLARRHPTSTGVADERMDFYANVGDKQQANDRTEDALRSFELSWDLSQRRQNPDGTPRPTPGSDLDYYGRVYLLNRLGATYRNLHRTLDAWVATQAALPKARHLAEKHESGPERRAMYAACLRTLGLLCADYGRADEGVGLLRRSVDLLDQVVRQDASQGNLYELLASLRDLADLHRSQGRRGEASDLVDRTDAIRQRTDPGDDYIADYDAQIAAVLRGGDIWDETRRTWIARRASERSLHALSGRLFEQALEARPDLLRDVKNRFAIQAARGFSLAAGGWSRGEPPLDDAARARLRGRALHWLRVELARWQEAFDRESPGPMAIIVPYLRRWRRDGGLVDVRDEAGLAALPAAEREEFRRFWADLDRLMARAAWRSLREFARPALGPWAGGPGSASPRPGATRP